MKKFIHSITLATVVILVTNSAYAIGINSQTLINLFDQREMIFKIKNLGMCLCDNAPADARIEAISAQIEGINNLKLDKDNELVIVVFGSGGLFQTYALIIDLIKDGYKNISVVAIDPINGNEKGKKYIDGLKNALNPEFISNKNIKNIAEKISSFKIYPFAKMNDYIEAVKEDKAPKGHSYDLIDQPTVFDYKTDKKYSKNMIFDDFELLIESTKALEKPVVVTLMNGKVENHTKN